MNTDFKPASLNYAVIPHGLARAVEYPEQLNRFIHEIHYKVC